MDTSMDTVRKRKKENDDSTILERRLARVPLGDELKNYVRLIMKNPWAATARQDAKLDRELHEMARTGAAEGRYLPCSSEDVKNVKLAALDLIKTLSTRTKSPKQVFIENNPGLLVFEVDSYLSILEKHAGGKRDTSGAVRYDAKKSSRRTDGINAAFDEMIKSSKTVQIKDEHGEREVEVPVDEKLIQVIRYNRKEWLAKKKFFNSLKNIACDIFAEKHNFAYDRTTEIYREYKPQAPIVETGNRIADPGYFNKDFKLLPNKSTALRNCRYGLFVPYDPKLISPTSKKGTLPGAKLSAKKRK